MNAIVEQRLAEGDLLQVLQSSLYPGAALDSIRLVLGYCKAAGLDPMLKPVHIVPMWDRETQRMRDVIMPGVQLYRIQAARSGQFAGVGEPEFGPDVTTTLGGQTISYPEWCRVVVKRQLASGHVADFTAREYWLENYAPKGGKDKSVAPNAMWTKRPRGQLAKCATAQALRAAFPEIAAAYTREELEGKTLNDIDDVDPIDQPKNFGLTPGRAKIVRACAGEAIQAFNEDRPFDAWAAVCDITDNDEKLALWSILKPHSALRSSLKASAAEQSARDAELAAMPVPAATSEA